MTRKEQIDNLAEILEAVMKVHHKGQELELISQANAQFMLQTNSILQRNLYSWAEEQVDKYVARVGKYSKVATTFNALKTNQASQQMLNEAYYTSISILEETMNQFEPELKSATEARNKEILEEVLVPHNLICRFLKNQLLNL